MTTFDEKQLEQIYQNIDTFSKQIANYKNILFICGDYPGYGGAATNCHALSEFYKKKGHNTYNIYYNFEEESDVDKEETTCIIDTKDMATTIKNLKFKPNLVLLKSFVPINLKSLLICPIFYLVGGIYQNTLNDYYYNLKTKEENDKFINQYVINEIKRCDKSFCNSSHTQRILQDTYQLKTELFYSTFVTFYGQNIIEDPFFDNRKYDYAFIVSNFNRKIKNIDASIKSLKRKENVLLIGKGASKYKEYGFECVDFVKHDMMREYYRKIKYLVQDSFYESCSNVIAEGFYNGCLYNFPTQLGILLYHQWENNYFHKFINLLASKLSITVFVYYSKKVKNKNKLNGNFTVHYVNDTNINSTIINIKNLLILYLPLYYIDDFEQFDKLMYNTEIKKYLFLGGIVNHMYQYIDKYNITNTIGYGNSYTKIYKNINHYNLKEYAFPTYNKVVKSKKKLNKSFIHVGRLSIEKNQTFLVNGFYEFLKNIKDDSYKLYIVYKNNNSIKDYINAFRKKYNLEKNIILLDWMKQEDLFDFCIKHIDYNILTSTNEGLSGICLEMMNIGIPTVSSNIYCVNEIITNDENGLLFDYVDYINLLIKNKSNANNLVKDVNKYFDENLLQFVDTLKKTVGDEKLFNCLRTNCLTFITIFKENKGNIEDVLSKYRSDDIAKKKPTQLYVAEHLRQYYKNALLTSNNYTHGYFTELHDYTEPCVFYGMFSENDMLELCKVKNKKAIVWTGGDINIKNRGIPWIKQHIIDNINRINTLRNVKHISITSNINRSLDNVGLDYIEYPFMGINFNEFYPTKKGKSIYFYAGNCEEAYGIKLFMEVYDLLKFKYDFKITSCFKNINKIKYYLPNIIHEPLNIPRNKIYDLYKECFIGLRFTCHDGLSGSVQELGCMGIKTINNSVDSPSTIKYNDVTSIINIIHEEARTINTVDHRLAWKTKKFLTITTDLFNFNNHKSFAPNSNILFVVNNYTDRTINGVMYFRNVYLIMKRYYNINYIYIDNIDNEDLSNYNYILFDSLIMNPLIGGITHLNINLLFKKYFSNKIIILLGHDLHFWTYNSRFSDKKDNLFRQHIEELPDNYATKNEYYFYNVDFLKELNIGYFISLYNNKELSNYVNDCTIINRFYINPYSASCVTKLEDPDIPQFYEIFDIVMKYDIVLYGNLDKDIYPIRHRIKTILLQDNNKRVNILSHDLVGSNQGEINRSLNESWMAVSDMSSYKYLVRKYFEIPLTKCVLFCEGSPELVSLIGNNFINISIKMNNRTIRYLLDYYISNKEILCYLSFHTLSTLRKKNNKLEYFRRLIGILEDILDPDINNIYEYTNYNRRINNIPNLNFFYIKKRIVRYIPYCICKLTKDIKLKYTDIYKSDTYNYYVLDNESSDFNTIVNNGGEIYEIKKYKIIEQIYIPDSYRTLINSHIHISVLFEYKYDNCPSFFYGIRSSLHKILTHKDISIIYFSGNKDDITFLKDNQEVMHKLNNNIDVFFVTSNIVSHRIMNNHKIKNIYDCEFLKNRNQKRHIYTEIPYRFNINYYFDKIYVLNMEKDIEKRNRIINLFNKVNINNYEIFNAIDGKSDKNLKKKYENYSKIPFTEREMKLGRKLIGSVGVLANLISVKKIILDAKKNNYKRILFLEDDIIIHKNFNGLFTEITSKLEDDWKLLYLGIQNNITNNIIMDNIYDCNGENLSGGWAFGLDSSVYDEIINECKKEDLPFDSGPLYYVRRNYPKQSLVMYPNLVICDTSSSSIRKYQRELVQDAMKFKWELEDYYGTCQKPTKKRIIYIWTGNQSHDKWLKNIKITQSLMRVNETFDFIQYRDIKNIKSLECYDKVIIEFLTISYLNDMDTNAKLKELFRCNIDIYVIIHDMHYYTFNKKNDIYGKTIRNKITEQERIESVSIFNNFLSDYNIENVIFSYECAEQKKILEYCHNIKNFYILNLAVDTSIIHTPVNFSYDQKIYDIIIFGESAYSATAPLTYPIRNRLYKIMQDMKDNEGYNIGIFGNIEFIELPKIISSSWLTVSCSGFSKYMCQKYFEIPACKSVIIGDMPYRIYNNNYINIELHMSDREIIDIIIKNLDNKDKLIEMAEDNYNIIQEQHTYKNYNSKLENIVSDDIK